MLLYGSGVVSAVLTLPAGVVSVDATWTAQSGLVLAAIVSTEAAAATVPPGLRIYVHEQGLARFATEPCVTPPEAKCRAARLSCLVLNCACPLLCVCDVCVCGVWVCGVWVLQV